MSNPDRDFDSWFRYHYRIVLSSVLVACTGDLPSAEDATNDAFLDALEKWDRVGSMDAPHAWVTKVAINKAKRSWIRKRRFIEPVNVDGLDVVAASVEARPEVWEAVASLSARQREAIALRYVLDMTQDDIATELGVARGTVSASLTQARSKLRVKLRGHPT